MATDEELVRSALITDPNLPDNPIIYVSKEFEHHTGYSPAEAVGRNARFLQGAETDQNTVRLISEALKARRPITVDILNYHKDGTAFIHRLAIRPSFDAEGRLQNFIAVQSRVPEGSTFQGDEGLGLAGDP
ncbi:MAG: PAS domain-containing protein [Marivibrio sp.]|uniref:PAS domain-containing protein n=1 Tax=Marivibrio sp. TaxID=2039719 RepID=UPI0032EB014D